MKRWMAIAVLAVSMLMGAASAPALACDHDVVVINASHRVIAHIYMSRSNIDAWQEDLLHGGVLLPGRAITIDVDDGSGSIYYDFRAVTYSGAAVQKWHVNTCVAESWTIND